MLSSIKLGQLIQKLFSSFLVQEFRNLNKLTWWPESSASWIDSFDQGYCHISCANCGWNYKIPLSLKCGPIGLVCLWQTSKGSTEKLISSSNSDPHCAISTFCRNCGWNFIIPHLLKCGTMCLVGLWKTSRWFIEKPRTSSDFEFWSTFPTSCGKSKL